MAETILRAVMPRLHQIAVRQIERERYFAPLSATELISEVWIQKLHNGGFQLSDREHFYCIAAHAMRQVLVDLARRRLALSRGAGVGPRSINVADEDSLAAAHDLDKIVEVGQLMERLEAKDRLAARIVDLHYYAGFTINEIADITGLTARQVRHRWNQAEKWLKDNFSG